jgi:hypothetical protein
MIPFQVDPAWYEHHWWRRRASGRQSATWTRLVRAAESTGRFLKAALRFFGYVLFLIVTGDFRLPRGNVRN